MDARTVAALNVLLRGELSAVVCYQRVLRRLPNPVRGREEIEESLDSHHGRAACLALEIAHRNGRPLPRPGAWARVLGLLAGVLSTISFRIAVRLLELVEIRGIERYDSSWVALDESARELLATSLFPQQVLSHQSAVLLNEIGRRFVVNVDVLGKAAPFSQRSGACATRREGISGT